MKQFKLEIPTSVFYGRGTAEEVLKGLKNTLGEKVMIITTSQSLFTSGAIDEVKGTVEELIGNNRVIIYNSVSPEPQLSEIKEAIREGKDAGITSVIGFGGGSSIDAAKGTALGIGSLYTIDEYFYDGRIPEESTIPVIAMPTTAGTGSELSGSAVISDFTTGIKKGIRNSFMYPAVAIVDPKYTDTMPFKITRDSGFDAFAHAMETYLSVKATPFSDLLAEQAVSMIVKALPRLRYNLLDTEARDIMSYASMLMGINIGNVGTLLPHRLQYPVGIKTHTSHGLGLLALFPAWVAEEYEHNPEKVCRMASIICGNDCKTKDECMTSLLGFLDSINGIVSLGNIGVSEMDIDVFVSQINGILDNDPAFKREDVVEKIYRHSM